MARRMTEKKTEKPTSLRMSETARLLWEATADRLGLSMGATVEMAIRKLAYSEGIEVSSLRKEETTQEDKKGA